MPEADLKLIYEQYFDRIYYYLRKRVNSDDLAFDLAQDTFVKALNYYDENKVINTQAWLYKCAYNTFLAHIKKNRLDEKPIDEVIEATEMKADYDFDFALVRKSIERELHQKNPLWHELFVLRVDYQLTLDELVEVVGKSKSTVRRALENVKSLIYQQHKDELNLKLTVKGAASV